jgi:hypothetical protein
MKKIKIMEAGIEMYESLLESINAAGGESSFYCWEALKDMTVPELISNLATSGIRFAHYRIRQLQELTEDDDIYKED